MTIDLVLTIISTLASRIAVALKSGQTTVNVDDLLIKRTGQQAFDELKDKPPVPPAG